MFPEIHNKHGSMNHLETLLTDLKEALNKGIFVSYIYGVKGDKSFNLIFRLPKGVSDNEYRRIQNYLKQYPQVVTVGFTFNKERCSLSKLIILMELYAHKKWIEENLQK
jgi:hypothetical protein